MYKIMCDKQALYDLRDDRLVLSSPKVTFSDNSPGSLDFTMLPNHPNYDAVKRMKSVIRVFDDGTEIFCGRVTGETKDFHNRKKIHCEGELGYLNDTIQRPNAYHNTTVRGYLKTLLDIHNSQTDEDKQFKIGTVTVTDSNDSVYKYTNWESTMQVIKTDLLDTFGGHLRVRKVNGVRYLDYLQDYPNKNTQIIRFGENLLDFTHDIDGTNIATAIIPLGGKLETSSVQGLDERLTIKSVNKDCDYVYSDSAVKTYGWIFKTVTFDNVTVPTNLKRKGEEYLKDIQFEDVQLTVKALDLHMVDVHTERIKMLDEIRVISKPNGLDRYFPVTKMTVYLDNPSNNTIVLGQKARSGMTGTAASNNTAIIKKIDAVPSKSDILKDAQANATQLIQSSLNGHVVVRPDEILVMDTDNPDTATRVWRWNVNGWGYSNTGYKGQYTMAATMDGKFNASMITSGVLRSVRIEAKDGTVGGWKISEHKLTSKDGGASFDSSNGIIKMKNSKFSARFSPSGLKFFSNNKEIGGLTMLTHVNRDGTKGDNLSLYMKETDYFSMSTIDKNGKVNPFLDYDKDLKLLWISAGLRCYNEDVIMRLKEFNGESGFVKELKAVELRVGDLTLGSGVYAKKVVEKTANINGNTIKYLALE